MERIVIVGGGQAAGQAVAALRGAGFDGELHLVGEEPHLPYERPPLSKGVLLGVDEPDTCLMKKAEFYRDKEIELHLGTRATGLDLGAGQVVADGVGALSFDRLLLCTGSTLIRLPIAGSELEGVHYLRTWDDSLRLRDELRTGCKLVVVGGGYIGLEVAAAGIARGCEVRVLEASDGVMGRSVAPAAGAIIRRYHEAKGVVIDTGARASALEGEGRVRAVRTEDGARHDADTVVVGIGVRPEIALAEQAGLTIDGGIAVDGFGQTSDARVFAAGDATSQPNTSAGRRLRIESWQNAQFQAMVAARAMLGSRRRAHDMVPWFWSDQGELQLQMLGVPARWDDVEVVFRGDGPQAPVSAFYVRNGSVVGLTAIGTHDDVRPAKKLIERATPVDLDRLRDPAVPLGEL